VHNILAVCDGLFTGDAESCSDNFETGFKEVIDHDLLLGDGNIYSSCQL
jgi:hypothetical protein